ncbi:CPBP family intramembrane metalloprotease [Ruegeria pomeroyi]|nr:CPBP family intramembrane glutamic endopeptidase [Ruegeria pomeroyi]NVK99508.1 CPBP family intramembrane metalloprotease [Ruegeria pomeroyi]NVL03236.1 CPBP family intramembrane metalloprotease [Ruegeria pomeroyi]QWV10556.1 CPBP family intramembrane metalloprotease [Ruegeria pomeroyi]HCE71583.1 CPBP family intramembrane metalloprotease [Ruegeria sp.]
MPDRPAYTPHEQLVAPGRARPELWRLIAGLIAIGVIVMAANMVLYGAVNTLASPEWAAGFTSGTTPDGLLVLLGSFGFVIVGVGVAACLFQHRAPLGILGPPRLALRQFWQVFRLLLVLGVLLLILPPYDMGAPLKENLPPGRWLLLLPLSILALLIQTGAEEILFRGYVQQALAARFRSALIWMVLPSVLFALGHYLPQEAGGNALPIALWSGVFGILMADITARAGTLGPAIALHLFNNMIALLIVSLPDSLSGLSLYLLPYSMADTEHLRAWLAVDFATMFVTWLLARLALRR